MSKKLVIWLSVILGTISVVLILLWTLFGLSTVTVEFSSTTQNLSVSNAEIIKAGKFKKGVCVLFQNKQKHMNSIMAHAKENENFAYIKITNIETKFPNKYVIHLVEREELFAVESEDKQFFICDRDFRVLRVVDDFQSTPENPILLQKLKFSNENVNVGDFLDIEQKSMQKFYAAMLSNNRDLNEQEGKFKQIELGEYEEGGEKYFSIRLTTFQNRVFQINNPDFAFNAKVQKMFAAESAIYSQPVDENGNILNSSGEQMFVVLSESGEYVPYDEQEGNEKVAFNLDLLSHCMLKVDNLPLSKFVKRTEKDIYYSLVELNV